MYYGDRCEYSRREEENGEKTDLNLIEGQITSGTLALIVIGFMVGLFFVN